MVNVACCLWYCVYSVLPIESPNELWREKIRETGSKTGRKLRKRKNLQLRDTEIQR